jgi:hypothetical protein
MKHFLEMTFAIALVAGATVVQADTIAYNSAPAAGFHYGTGNNYTPANTAVLTTTASDQLYLRTHKTFQAAPASVGNVYSFALGTTPLSFDWGFNDSSRRGVVASALITLKNIGTGATFSYNPLYVGNDNTVFGNDTQNSFRFNWVPLAGFFTPNVNSTYKVNLDVNNLAGGSKSLSVFAKLGEGAGTVPEPASWAMLLVGFGGVGAILRRKRPTFATIAA